MSNPFIGQISALAFNFAPAQWAFCNGSIIDINSNQALFALLGNLYGGDGRVTFSLPNLTSRSTVGFNMGSAPGLQVFPEGYMGGSQSQALQHTQLPSHNHTATFVSTGSSTSVKMEATTDDGDTAQPSAGTYLAQAAEIPGPDARELMYKSDPAAGSFVSVGGVSGGGGGGGGTIAVQNNGSGQTFPINNPYTAINFSIALLGVFPPRN